MIELLIWIIKLLCLIVILLSFGLLFEKALHQEETAEQIAKRFKNNIKTIIKVLFTKEKDRHVFDISLFEGMKEVAQPYHNGAFEDIYNICMYHSVPCLEFIFVPRGNITDEELQEVTSLLLLKFRDYLFINKLNYLSFAMYQLDNNRIVVTIYYAEFKEDVKPFKSLYRRIIDEHTDHDYGVLHDADLDKELNNVS